AQKHLRGPQGAGLANPPVEALLEEFDEFAVVEAAKRGHQGALSDLYEHYFPKVYRYVASRLGNTEDAEDVTEELFLKIVQRLGGFSWRGLPFGAWLFRIARNEVVTHVRKVRSRATTAPLSEMIPDSREDHTLAVELESTMAGVRKAMERLP